MRAATRSFLAESVSSIVVLAAAVGISLAVVAVSGASSSAAASALLRGAFGSAEAFESTVVIMIPLVLTALAWILALRAGLFNVGMTGQIILGGIGAAIVAVELSLPGAFHLLVAMSAGVLAGIAWAAIPATLWATRGVNTIISTLLLNFVAVEILAWVLQGPLQEPNSPFVQTAPFPDSATWPSLIGVVDWDVVLVGLLVVLVALVLRSTTFGLRLRLTAANPDAARRSGIATTRVRTYALLASGALAGLAGSSLVLGGQLNILTAGFQGTYGFDGIAVALLARNVPLATIPAALLFAALIQGGGLMQTQAGVPASLVGITIGTVVLGVAASGLLTARLRRLLGGSGGARSKHDDPAPALETVRVPEG